jgi:hypothetical protein
MVGVKTSFWYYMLPWCWIYIYNISSWKCLRCLRLLSAESITNKSCLVYVVFRVNYLEKGLKFNDILYCKWRQINPWSIAFRKKDWNSTIFCIASGDKLTHDQSRLEKRIEIQRGLKFNDILYCKWRQINPWSITFRKKDWNSTIFCIASGNCNKLTHDHINQEVGLRLIFHATIKQSESSTAIFFF